MPSADLMLLDLLVTVCRKKTSQKKTKKDEIELCRSFFILDTIDTKSSQMVVMLSNLLE